MSTDGASFPWIPLIAAFGMGTVIAAVVGWWSAKAVAISNHRQNWINGLRDDLAEFFKQIDLVHIRFARTNQTNATSDELLDLQKAGVDAKLAHRRVLMRLNMTEQESIKLADQLSALLTVKSSSADENAINAAINASRSVIKREWDVTKYGIFTCVVLWIKRRLNLRLYP